jgi:hypothetical protein
MALTPEQRASNDRRSWAKSRAKTGNWSSRAYNLAIQDAARYVRENFPALWADMYAVRVEEQKARVAEEQAVGDCAHDVIEEIEVTLHSLKCKDCGSILGSTTAGTVPKGYQVFTGDGGRVAYRRTVMV